jgi:large-conductance mechanosensitive channel
MFRGDIMTSCCFSTWLIFGLVTLFLGYLQVESLNEHLIETKGVSVGFNVFKNNVITFVLTKT